MKSFLYFYSFTVQAMSLQNNLAALPIPLQNQVGAYLHKEIPAHCEVITRDTKKNKVKSIPPEKTTDDTLVIYNIKRNNKVKFNYETDGTSLQEVMLSQVDKFIAGQEVGVTLVSERTDFEIRLQKKTNTICVTAFNNDISTFRTNFNAKHYKAAFDAMFKDLMLRIEYFIAANMHSED